MTTMITVHTFFRSSFQNNMYMNSLDITSKMHDRSDMITAYSFFRSIKKNKQKNQSLIEGMKIRMHLTCLIIIILRCHELTVMIYHVEFETALL